MVCSFEVRSRAQDRVRLKTGLGFRVYVREPEKSSAPQADKRIRHNLDALSFVGRYYTLVKRARFKTTISD